MLHGVIHCALQTLIAEVHLLLRQPAQSLLDVQVVHIVIQVIVPQTFTTDSPQQLRNPKQNRRERGVAEELGFGFLGRYRIS